MARSFRESRFRGKAAIGEDVNPAAYIVNLADCMLVLACGFMVALMSYWNISLSTVEELDADTQLEEVDPEQLPENLSAGGSYYTDAGRVVQDPKTGTLYLIQEGDLTTDASESETAGSGTTSLESAAEDVGGEGEGSSAAGSVSGGGSEEATDSSYSDEEIRSSRASGAD